MLIVIPRDVMLRRAEPTGSLNGTLYELFT